MKTFKLIFFLFSSFYFAQKIEWKNDYNLIANDFQGSIPKTETDEVAGSMINIEYKILSTSIWTGKVKIRIYPTFAPSISWIKSEHISKKLLNHEQKHFDIAQIYSLKLQKLVDKRIKNTNEFNELFKNLYNENYNEYSKFQEKYDLETEHGTIQEQQDKYDKLIEDMLKNCNNR